MDRIFEKMNFKSVFCHRQAGSSVEPPGIPGTSNKDIYFPELFGIINRGSILKFKAGVYRDSISCLFAG
jgi:hypothetical protein